MVYTCAPSTWGVDAGASKAEGYSWPHSKLPRDYIYSYHENNSKPLLLAEANRLPAEEGG